MADIKEMYKNFGISEDVYDYSVKITDALKQRFQEIDIIAEYNQLKVVNAMQKNQVSEAHFAQTTGYGYNDLGRDTLEKVYADIFHTEDALVRPQITCGTHALGLALSANLRPGDKMVYISGKPYDTLEEVIGIRESKGSLREYGVTYDQVDLLDNGDFDFDGIKNKLTSDVKLVGIQRSKGYATRPTLSVKKIGEAVSFVKETGIDCLAVAVGTSHGVYKGKPHLEFDLLSELSEKIQIPLVLHGGSGTGDDNLAKAVCCGIQKVNLFTDLSNAGLKSLMKYLGIDWDQMQQDGTKGEFANMKANLCDAGLEAGKGYKELLCHYIELFGGVGKI